MGTGGVKGVAYKAPEERVSGECGRCGEAVTLVRNSVASTCRSDGNRYIYPDREDMQHAGWCIFRCRGCSDVIDANRRPLQTTIAA